MNQSFPETGWYVLIGDQKYGPYEYKVMIHMMQTNQLMDYTYIWAEHLDSWTQVGLLEEFSRSRLQVLLQQQSPEFSDSFILRKNKRSDVKIPLLGHNSTRFFDGELLSISENGGMCLINSPLVQVGDRVKLHIKPQGDSERAFNVEAEVIRKNFSKQRLNTKSGLHYAIKFHDIQPVGLNQIKKWVAA